MIGFIECHRKISKGAVRFPGCNDFAFVAIYDGHMSSGRDIHEDTMSLFLQLECFWMCSEFYRSNLFSIGGVDDPYSTAAKAHINSFRRAIVTNVVGIIA